LADLWQIEDQGHPERALNGISTSDPKARAAMAELSAVVEREQTRFLETLSFGNASSHP
jgi:hypothetical protein